MNCKKGEYIGSCPLCGREMICGKSVNEHYPIQKNMGGRKKVFMHKVSHQRIHSLFTERELAKQYHDFKVLKEVSELQSFIKWV